MTTHRRAWVLRAGVVVALVVGALVAVPTAALADTDLSDISLSPGSIGAGETTTVRFTVRKTNPVPEQINVSVTSSNGKVRCSGTCSWTAVTFTNDDDSRDFEAKFQVAGNTTINQGESATITIRAGNDQQQQQLALEASQQKVAKVSGKVRDTDTKEGIEGALVALADSQKHNCTTTTNGSGNYSFTSCDGQPIAVGQIFVGVQAEDYGEATTKQVNANANQSVTVGTFNLKSTTAASPSATPEATASAQAATEEAQASTEPTNLAANNASDESGSGLGSWLLIIVGGLLVALGVGAIVLLVIRRKQDGGEDEDELGAPVGPRSPVPGAQGVYHPAGDPTRVANRAGAGADPTMVGRPSLADAPTMMHNPVPAVDEFPDPYGAPMPGQGPNYAGAGGYAPTQAGYGPPAGAAGAAGVYGAQQPANGYGGSPNGPTSGAAPYGRPTSGGGYGPPPGGPANGYGGGPANGYGGPAAPAGYSSPAAPADPYSGPPAGRGDDGYGRDYGQQAPGYGSPAQSGGYGNDRYDEPTGRYDAGGGYGQPQQPAAPYESGPYGGGGQRYRPEPEPERGGYGQGGGYAPREDPYGGRPGAGTGYEPGGGGYGQADGGYGAGYDQRGDGYDAPGGGYDRVPEQRGGGYDRPGYEQQGGYYDDQGGGGQQPPRHGGPQQPAGRRAERRPLDWLDD